MSAKRHKDRPLGGKIGADHPMADVIADAYLVFSYPAPQTLGVCRGCCMDPDIERDFLNPTIDQMPLSYVRDWFFAAADPVIPKSTWGYLLPRVMEVLASGEDPSSVGPEVSLNRFPTGVRENWTQAEWAVIDRFQRAFLDQCKDPLIEGGDYLDDYICTFALAGFDLDDLLDQVWNWSDAELTARLYNDWCYPGMQVSIWLTAFWEGELIGKTHEWYTSAALNDRMVAYCLDDATPPPLARMAEAVSDAIHPVGAPRQT